MMKVTQHGEFLFQLTRFANVFPVSCYLVKENDGLSLIDTGLPGSEKDILGAAELIGLPITRILLTHAHADHVGSLDAIGAALPSAAIAISRRESRLLAGDMTLDVNERKSKLRGSFQRVAAVPTLLLEPGQNVGSLTVVDAAGHTPGHISFYDCRDRSLIAGDSWQTAAGLAVAGIYRPLFPWPAMATWDKVAALASARRLLDLNPSRLAVGHGPVMEEPASEMSKAIEYAARQFGGTIYHAF